jgi:16S rRNA A1518/A1519 N6-dimethyltransferase RsmA/KsgA/DIM1 with predicted DNA glycosylase/AP lyase activity
MSQQKEKIEAVIKEIDEVVDLFYQQKLKTALERLEHLLADIAEAMDGLFQYGREQTGFEFDENKLTSTLNEAMGALEEQDLVLLADILQYDFREYLQELTERMK